MSKVKKYTSFEALKSETKPLKQTEKADKALMEYEAFLTLLQQQHLTNQQTKAADGKHLS
jgi:hypothetical protein